MAQDGRRRPRPRPPEAIRPAAEDHIRLVQWTINRMAITSMIGRATHGAMDTDDMLSVGLVAAWRAEARFDPSRGCRWSSYAVPCIRGEILDAIKLAKRGAADCDLGDLDPPGAPDPPETDQSLRLSAAWDHLTEPQRELVTALMDGWTQTEVAARWHVSASRVWQIYHDVLGKLRRDMRGAAA